MGVACTGPDLSLTQDFDDTFGGGSGDALAPVPDHATELGNCRMHRDHVVGDGGQAIFHVQVSHHHLDPLLRQRGQ